VAEVRKTQPSRTWREGRAVDRFVVSRGVGLEIPAITGEVPEQQQPKTSSARNAKLLVRKGERTTRSGIQEALSWRSPAARQETAQSANIGSDASRHHRQPRYHRCAELIGERRSVADVKH